ncbi:MAG: class I SAM-dependent methyltransferase [bacterium]|nr:class I SAM-dependent methyltransferase [bacterium]
MTTTNKHTPSPTLEKSSPTADTKSAWYKDWFDENYLKLYSHRNHGDAKTQVDLITATLELPKETAILDLACGEGRYTAIFKEMGYEITGMDLSETLINSGKKKYPHLNLEVGDMRNIRGEYDLVLSLFTSFGYFDEDSENEKVLHAVFNALKPGGLYWFDFLNAAAVTKNLVPESLSRPSDGMEVLEKRRIEKGRIVKDIRFRNGDKETCYRESVRLFTQPMLEEMFKRVGFQLIHVFGDYNGGARAEESPRVILVGQR